MCGACTSVPGFLFPELGGKTRQTQSLLWMSTSQEKKRTIMIVHDNGYKGAQHDLRGKGGLPRGPDVQTQGWNMSGNLCIYLSQILSPLLPVIILQMHMTLMRAAKYTDPLATAAGMNPRLEPSEYPIRWTHRLIYWVLARDPNQANERPSLELIYFEIRRVRKNLLRKAAVKMKGRDWVGWAADPAEPSRSL